MRHLKLFRYVGLVLQLWIGCFKIKATINIPESETYY